MGNGRSCRRFPSSTADEKSKLQQAMQRRTDEAHKPERMPPSEVCPWWTPLSAVYCFPECDTRPLLGHGVNRIHELMAP